MTPAEIRAKIADIVTQVDGLIDDRQDVTEDTRLHLDRAASLLTSAYFSVPGRWWQDKEGSEQHGNS